ncbi:hypothetical protein GNF80_01305 [Clostridium perfringens]|nr:hypothetical protein [Clostridium perfringens]
MTLSLTKNLIFYVKEYKSFLANEKEFNYLLNAEIYLDYRFLNRRVEEVTVNPNKDYISIKFWEEEKLLEDKIEKRKNTLSLSFVRYGEYYSHALLDDVEKFDVIEKENLFYIRLKVNNQDERVYCYEKG